jgi:hypothetical protein
VCIVDVLQGGRLLYLAKHRIKGRLHYFIRESYEDGGCYRSRELFCLGTNPARYIVYPGGNAVYIDEVVEDTLCSLGVKPGTDDIEDVFWPFIKPEVRRVIESFSGRARARRKRIKMVPGEAEQIQRQVREFDKRRIHYLRSGRMDQGTIGRMPVQLYKWLAGKSRDEIEQRFMKMEQYLKPRELKNYVFVIFDLQRFFTESWAKQMPQGLDQNKIDKHFVEEICRLNSDVSFWSEEQAKDSLHEYLIRYVVMFFDQEYRPDSFLQDYIKEFMDARRAWRIPPGRSSVTLDEASVIFGVKKDVLKTMTKRSLVRLYRRMAKKLHPDKGGTSREFVQLTEVYHALLRSKGKTRRWYTKR